MRAVRLHKFHEMPRVDEVPEPVISGPFDVIVRNPVAVSPRFPGEG